MFVYAFCLNGGAASNVHHLDIINVHHLHIINVHHLPIINVGVPSKPQKIQTWIQTSKHMKALT